MSSSPAYFCDALRTPIGRYGGALAHVRADDLAAIPIAALVARHPTVDWHAVDDCILGCANQSGEDNRNVARMALLLAGLDVCVSGVTVNRLCGSGLEAVAMAARMIVAGEADLLLAGGVESMSRAPYVMPKPSEAFQRAPELYDTTLGWRFVNPRMKASHGVDALAETAELVAERSGVTREAQDRFAEWSQRKAAATQAAGLFAREMVPVAGATQLGNKTDERAALCSIDEHPRATSIERLAQLRPITRPNGTVTAGNASGINDGAACLILASEEGMRRHGLTPLARVLGATAIGVEPRTMGIGPVPATKRLLAKLGLSLEQFDLIELNEAFAAQALACMRELGLDDQDPRVNPHGGAIALGHPLGMSGARLVGTAMHQLTLRGQNRALCTMCIGVGQGVALAIERV